MPKITQLNEVISLAIGDKVPVVDKSDTTQSADGSTKFIDWENLQPNKIATQKIENVALGILGSGSCVVDLSSGDFFYGIQTGNLDVQITGDHPSVAGLKIDLLMSGSGSYTVSLPSTFQSLAATAPTIYSETGKHNVFVCHTTDSGVNWLYSLGGGGA